MYKHKYNYEYKYECKYIYIHMYMNMHVHESKRVYAFVFRLGSPLRAMCATAKARRSLQGASCGGA